MKGGEVTPVPAPPSQSVRRSGRVKGKKRWDRTAKRRKRPAPEHDETDEDKSEAEPNGRGSVINIVA